jgi:ribA/ribD-fused uncharacterized protein
MRIQCDRIDSFSGEFGFLSNFYLLKNPVHDSMRLSYYTVENAFHASKSLYRGDRLDLQKLSPAKAKQAGQHVNLREDWDRIKRGVMLDFLLQKFLNNSELALALAHTGQAELIEGNHWGDQFWGVYNGSGDNHLGKLLMLVRGLCT